MASEDFSEKGFLSSSVFVHKKDVRHRYSDAFSQCEEISDIAHQLLLSADADPSDTPTLTAFLFCERTLRTCQAAIRLCELGLIQEAQILLRTAFETSFHAQALLVKPEIFRLLDAHSEKEEAKHARDMLAHIPEDQISDDDRLLLLAMRDTGKAGNFSVFESARVAGMLEHYAVAYRGLSALAGHATFRSLDRSFLKSEEGFELRIGPSEEQLVFTLSLTAQCIGFAVRSLKCIIQSSLASGHGSSPRSNPI